jgi:ABC-type branched-subunit amino acid transport system substrate-binding protein
MPELVERAGKFIQCSIYVDGFYADSERPATKRFVAAYREVHGKEPMLLEAIGHDVAKMARQVIESRKPQTREEFRSALAELRDFDGATGTTSFTDKREAKKPLFFLGIDTKGVKELKPPPATASATTAQAPAP